MGSHSNETAVLYSAINAAKVVREKTGGISDKITRDERDESRCRRWRRELLCSRQFSGVYKGRGDRTRLSLISSAQSGIHRRKETMGEKGEEGEGSEREFVEQRIGMERCLDLNLNLNWGFVRG